ncbi:hypothetical protein AB0M39_40190 [Streptomyces sp. NPDC051907]|uniref:hypothetical protein n=1 Tax=Streptomyces sp. NPDC051907 TaxID=3155284 RepID=UPI00341CB41A
MATKSQLAAEIMAHRALGSAPARSADGIKADANEQRRLERLPKAELEALHADYFTVAQWFTFGPFLFSIDQALEIIAATPDRQLHTIDVPATARMLSLEKPMAEYLAEGRVPLLRGDVDEDYALTQADLSVPVIMADLAIADDGEPAYMLIDGTHRVRRAYAEGVATLQAYALDRDETRTIRTEATLGPGRTRRR